MFEYLNSSKIAELIHQAENRVILALPGVQASVADAIIGAHERLGAEKVTVTIDCSEEVFRLGYGDIEAVNKLKSYGCNVLQSNNLRLGTLVCDTDGWVFAPIALYVEDERDDSGALNAIRMNQIEAQRIANRTSMAARNSTQENNLLQQDANSAQIEVGAVPLDESLLNEIEKKLEIAPPVPFDVARQVRVFQPYIQYVDVSLNGCSIERKKVKLPNHILNIDSESELSNRINTTFNLIESDSGIALKKREIDDEVGILRETYTRPLGKPWGRVMLRAKKCEFDSKVKKLEKTIAEYQKEVEDKIENLIFGSIYRLVEYYTPNIINEPPQSLSTQIQSAKPTIKQAQQWLFDELSNIFPRPETLVKKMSLQIQYRDVTYETLNEDGFADALKKAYPYMEWEKPFNEFKAVKAKKQAILEEA